MNKIPEITFIQNRLNCSSRLQSIPYQRTVCFKGNSEEDVYASSDKKKKHNGWKIFGAITCTLAIASVIWAFKKGNNYETKGFLNKIKKGYQEIWNSIFKKNGAHHKFKIVDGIKINEKKTEADIAAQKARINTALEERINNSKNKKSLDLLSERINKFGTEKTKTKYETALKNIGKKPPIPIENKKISFDDIFKKYGISDFDKQKILEEVKKEGLTEEQLINRIKYLGKNSGSMPSLLYSNKWYDYYKTVRSTSTPYKLSPNSTRNIDTITSTGNKHIKVMSTNGWHYRFAVKNIGGNKCIDRISLNVYPEEELIKKLDKYMIKSNINFEYKCPDYFNGWQRRHDPITIYFREPLSEQVEKDIVKIATPYTRKTKQEVLIGKKLADSIYKVKEPTEADVQELRRRIHKLNFDTSGLMKCLETPGSNFGGGIYHISSSTGKKRVHTSPGIIEAWKRMLDDIEKFKLNN